TPCPRARASRLVEDENEIGIASLRERLVTLEHFPARCESFAENATREPSGRAALFAIKSRNESRTNRDRIADSA
ncbi:MAG: hypothetical protein ACXWVK_09380, partial [Rhodoplanes sp.]